MLSELLYIDSYEPKDPDELEDSFNDFADMFLNGDIEKQRFIFIIEVRERRKE